MSLHEFLLLSAFVVINSNLGICVFQIDTSPDLSTELQWTSFKAEHKKQYSNSIEEVGFMNSSKSCMRKSYKMKLAKTS